MTAEQVIDAIKSRQSYAAWNMADMKAKGYESSAEMWELVYHQFTGLLHDLEEIERKETA